MSCDEEVGDTYHCKTCELDPLCGTYITDHPGCTKPEATDTGDII